MLHEAAIQGIGVSMSGEGVGAPVVLLEARDSIVPIFVDSRQAQTIERARQGVPVERPMTHDLFVGVLDDLDVTIDQVRIDDLSDETFHAKLDLTAERGDERDEFVRDARPSDGLALAVRVECPVLVAADVIDEAGHPPEALGIDEAGRRGPGGVEGGGGREASGGEDEAIDLDDAVEIDIEDLGDTERDDDPDSR